MDMCLSRGGMIGFPLASLVPEMVMSVRSPPIVAKVVVCLWEEEGGLKEGRVALN